jgi:protein deglycase
LLSSCACSRASHDPVNHHNGTQNHAHLRPLPPAFMAATVATHVRRVLVPIAKASEEIEAVCIIDTLRRAKIDVFVAAGTAKAVEMSRGVKIVPDGTLEDAKRLAEEHPFDCIAVPGGMPGAATLAKDDALLALLRSQRHARRWVAAICAAPVVVLHANGLIPSTCAAVACYPSFQERLPEAQRTHKRVAVDPENHLITSQGPGTAIEFALEVVRQLSGAEVAASVGSGMLSA